MFVFTGASACYPSKGFVETSRTSETRGVSYFCGITLVFVEQVNRFVYSGAGQVLQKGYTHILAEKVREISGVHGKLPGYGNEAEVRLEILVYIFEYFFLFR